MATDRLARPNDNEKGLFFVMASQSHTEISKQCPVAALATAAQGPIEAYTAAHRSSVGVDVVTFPKLGGVPA